MDAFLAVVVEESAKVQSRQSVLRDTEEEMQQKEYFYLLFICW